MLNELTCFTSNCFTPQYNFPVLITDDFYKILVCGWEFLMPVILFTTLFPFGFENTF